jgi:glycosyltransferase involved in cell wall biosynthesis
LVRKGLPTVDVVLSIELMGVGLKHPCHLHLFFGSYAGFRDMALQPAGSLRLLARTAKAMVARMLERQTQGKLGAIANSSGLRDVLRARGITVRDYVVPPPTDCDRFTPGNKRAARAELGLPQDKRLILFGGRWEFAKGADRCARIFEKMPEDWHLLIVTPSGFTWPMLRKNNFTVLTDLDTDRMISAYRAADALVQPSRFEGYSLVASEAQACGLPVLTSRVGQAAHFEQSEQPLVRASVIDNADDAQEWISRLTVIFGSDETHNANSRAHRSYAEANVSFPIVQRTWERVLSEIFEDFLWQPR